MFVANNHNHTSGPVLTNFVAQVINGIQTGPYKNIYNPENFYVGKNGVGAANNWGDGYQTGESVHEDILEMIDREADGSDSLEVGTCLSDRSILAN